MIPLKDENPIRSFPFATVLIIAANLVVFGYEWTLPHPALKALVFQFGAIPAELNVRQVAPSSLADVPWITLITSMFLHGGFLHVGGNMLYLWIFGDNVEDAMGPVRFVVFYLACGLAAAFFQIAAMPLSRVPLVGASGAIAGILGAYALLYPTARVRTLVILFFFVRIVPIPALIILGMWFVVQILSVPASGSSGVAFFAHIGGFLCGMLLIGFFVRQDRRRAG
jgi:membrane associated rhomboid family serine protease